MKCLNLKMKIKITNSLRVGENILIKNLKIKITDLKKISG